MMQQLTKDLDFYMALPYPMQFTPAKSGWFAQIVMLPGCKTHASTWAEAHDQLIDAKRTWLTSALANGSIIPEP
ncbi:MAG: type II toxin-antitoxin system HicB family antitoxin [Armatimonadetes bacterium]|nr:type II toxin-antitoxin system HicB family antitoxin [Anaerolineae bacterium]